MLVRWRWIRRDDPAVASTSRSLPDTLGVTLVPARGRGDRRWVFPFRLRPEIRFRGGPARRRSWDCRPGEPAGHPPGLAGSALSMASLGFHLPPHLDRRHRGPLRLAGGHHRPDRPGGVGRIAPLVAICGGRGDHGRRRLDLLALGDALASSASDSGAPGRLIVLSEFLTAFIGGRQAWVSSASLLRPGSARRGPHPRPQHRMLLPLSALARIWSSSPPVCGRPTGAGGGGWAASVSPRCSGRCSSVAGERYRVGPPTAQPHRAP